MIDKRELQRELGRLGNFKIIVEAYEEISITQMRRIRENVLLTRAFLSDVNMIFAQVKASYKHEVETMMKKKHGKDIDKFQLRTSNGKTLFVLLSANSPLYGDIIHRTFNLFLKKVKTQPGVEAAIVGKIGMQYFLDEELSIPYQHFDMADDKILPDDLKKLIFYIIQYERVYVFHGRFKSLISQEPWMTSISGEELKQAPGNLPVIKYIFEPSLEKVIDFFETEILAAIFEQTIRESQLSKHASRMVTFDNAAVNVRESIKRVIFQEQQLKHKLINAKQLNILTSISLWNT